MPASRTLLHRTTTHLLPTNTLLSAPRSCRPPLSPTFPVASTTLSRTSSRRLFHASSPNMTVHGITSKAEFDKVVKENKLVILDASASWCGPCKMISPVLEKLSDNARFTGVYFAKFDVDEVGELAAELAIRAMPTFIAFNDGEKAGTLQGANPKALEDLVTKLADL